MRGRSTHVLSPRRRGVEGEWGGSLRGLLLLLWPARLHGLCGSLQRLLLLHLLLQLRLLLLLRLLCWLLCSHTSCGVTLCLHQTCYVAPMSFQALLQLPLHLQVQGAGSWGECTSYKNMHEASIPCVFHAHSPCPA